MSRALFALALLCAGAGCPGSLEEQAADELGPEPPTPGPGPTHRPNQPCLRCHSDANDEGEEVFAVAGTVYRYQNDTAGAEGLEVEITDAGGVVYRALTNAAGNFFLTEDEDVAGPEQDDDGELRVPAAPRFPLTVVVRDGGFRQEMKSKIWREGSCAECHTDPVSATSSGKIFARPPP